MKKLEQGDYVTNLTEEQFNEIVDLDTDTSISYINGDLCYNMGLLLHCGKNVIGSSMITELTFEEFKQRAINTFNK